MYVQLPFLALLSSFYRRLDTKMLLLFSQRHNNYKPQSFFPTMNQQRDILHVLYYFSPQHVFIPGILYFLKIYIFHAAAAEAFQKLFIYELLTTADEVDEL